MPYRDHDRDQAGQKDAAKSSVRRTAAATLTDRTIRALQAGQKRADGAAAPGQGRLVVRARKLSGETARHFYFRYWDADNKERSMFLGAYPDMTLSAARQAADEQRKVVRGGSDPRVKRDVDAQASRDADQQALIEGRKGTLADLIDGYVEHLKLSGKSSYADVERTMKRHVIKPFPALASKRAREITAEDVSDILARMISRGIGRRTNIVRANLRAAFAFGSKRDNDPIRKAAALRSADKEDSNSPVKLFGITANPAADVSRIAKYDRALDRTLTDDEIKHYWESLGKIHQAVADTLRVALLLGGQRMSQLKRATWADYDPKRAVLTLRDPKGRGDEREHVLPVSDRVKGILATLKTINSEGYIFSTTAGDKQVDLSTLSSAVTEIARKFWKKSLKNAYSARDLRRTVETRLAGMKISKEIRAQLLSHGRTSGVQERHYDKHDYLPEKTTALAKWEAHLLRVTKGESSTVIPGNFGRT